MANVQVRLFGDTAKAATYVGWAKNQCNWLIGQCVTLGLPFLDKTFMVSADVKVHIHATATNHTRNWVSIEAGGGCSLLSYHGLLRLGIYAPENVLRYESPLLYTEAAHLTGNTVWGSITVGESGLVPELGDDRPSSAPYPSGTAIPEFSKPTFSPGTSQAVINEKMEQFRTSKEALGQCPPSMYSGKLRLFIQSLYASQATFKGTRRWQPVSFSGVPGIRVSTTSGNTSLLNTSANSHGIYTDDDGNYWLVYIFKDGNYKVQITRMTPTPCGKNIIAWLKNAGLSREDKAIAEAYVLADITIDSEFRFTRDTGIPATHGSSVAYGWSFTWGGDKASIVMLEGSGSGPTSVNESTRVTINLHRDSIEFAPSASTPIQEESARWTISVDAQYKGAWMTEFSFQNIWIPDYTSNQLVLFQDLNTSIVSQGSGELYCFYDKSDTLKVIAIEASEFAGYRDTVVDPVFQWAGNYVWTLAGNGHAHDIQYAGGHEGVISVGGQVFPSLNKSLTSGNSQDWGIRDEQYDKRTTGREPAPPTDYLKEVTGYNQFITDYNDYINGLGYSCPNFDTEWVTVAEGWSTFDLLGSGTERERAIVIIPMNDCSGVFIGNRGMETSRVIAVRTLTTAVSEARYKVKVNCPAGGSPIFEFMTAATSPGESIVNTPTYPGTESTQADPTNYYIGYGGTVPVPVNWSYNQIAPSRSFPFSTPVNFATASAVGGETFCNYISKIGAYTGESVNSVFIGAA